jgi:hypothetical protein
MFKSAQRDVQSFAVEARALAGFATHVSGRHEVHFQLDDTRPHALRASPLRAVERKSARRIAAQPRLGSLREKSSNLVEKSDVRRRDRTQGAANGRLVHFVNRANGPGTGQGSRAGVRRRRFASRQSRPQCRQKTLPQQRAFSRTADAAQTNEPMQWKGNRQIL